MKIGRHTFDESLLALPVLAMLALIGFIALLMRLGTGKW